MSRLAKTVVLIGGVAMAGCLGSPEMDAAPSGSTCGIGTSPSRHELCLLAESIELLADEEIARAPDAGIAVQIWQSGELVLAVATGAPLTDIGDTAGIARQGDTSVIVVSRGLDRGAQDLADELLTRAPPP